MIDIGELIWPKKHCVDHEEFGISVRATSHHSYMFKGGYETLKKQCMHVLMTQCHISGADLVLKNGYFACNLIDFVGRKDIVLTIRRSDTLS